MAKLLTLHGQDINSTAYMLYAGELVLVPLFGLSRVRNSTSRVGTVPPLEGPIFALQK